MSYPGFITINSEEDVGTLANDPQPLFVESETLGIYKDIGKVTGFVRNERMANFGDLTNKAEKPKGQITYTFRSDDSLKVLLSHFQSGTAVYTGTYFRYTFYPTKYQIRNYTSGQVNLGTYGVIPNKAYTVAVSKKLTSGSPYVFNGGIADKLGFGVEAENTCSLSANYLFTNYTTTATYLGSPPGTAAGTYCLKSGFNFSSATVLIDGSSFPLNGLTFGGNHGAQEVTTVGQRTPKMYLFGDYEASGELAFDLPSNALSYVGSMLAIGSFSIVGTFYNGTADRVSFSMPQCVRRPFDYKASSSGMTSLGNIPFESFAGTRIIDVTPPAGSFTTDGAGSLGLMLDNNITTMFTGNVSTGTKYMHIDLGEPKNLNELWIYSAGGTTGRKYKYDIIASDDGTTWTTLTSNWETSAFPWSDYDRYAYGTALTYRYAGVILKGNNVNTIYNVAELRVYAKDYFAPLTVTVDTDYLFTPMIGTVIADTMTGTDTITNTISSSDTITEV